MAKLDWYIRANLKPRHLQLLITLDTLRHVGRTADYLNITQPAVSKALGEIERGLDVRLFERSPHGLMPTSYGECLIRLARSVLREFDTVRDELVQLKAGTTGRIRIGMLPVVAPVLVPRAVIQLRAMAPATAVVLHEGPSNRLLPMLREQLLDMVVGTLPSAAMQLGLQARVLHAGERIVVVCGRGHPLTRRETIEPADLAGYPLVLPLGGSVFRDSVDAAMDILGLTPGKGQIESGSMTATNTFVRSTEAISFYTEHMAQHYARLGFVQTLAVSVPVRTAPIGIVWPAHVELDAVLRAFVERLEEVASQVFKGVGEQSIDWT